MKIRTDRANIEYIVVPQAGIVKCRAGFLVYELRPFINKKYRYIFGNILEYPNKTLIQVEGIARCSSEDTFDEEIGKKIAHFKMRLKLYKKLQKLTEKSKEYINKLNILNTNLEYKLNNNYLSTEKALTGYIERKCK